MSFNSLLQAIPSPIKSILSRKVKRKLFDLYALNVWKRVFIEVSKESNAINKDEVKEIAASRSLTRYYYSMFHDGDLLDISKLTIAIGMEALDQKILIKEQDIISFSLAIYETWFREIGDNEILSSSLNRSYTKKIPDVKTILNQDEESDLLLILANPTLLRKEFFKTYIHTERKTSKKINVFLPTKDDYIDYNSPTTIEIAVNSYSNIDLGFFRIGYDYNLLDSNERAWTVAISKNSRAEAVAFNQQKFGNQSSKYIWIR
jgi:hypothetical protein